MLYTCIDIITENIVLSKAAQPRSHTTEYARFFLFGRAVDRSCETQVPATDGTEAEAFAESLAECPKAGLHNPLKNPERFL